MARVVPNEKLESLLKKELNTSELKSTGHFGGGCINEGQSYATDHGAVFVKMNKKPMSRRMFEGESLSLELLQNTGVVRVPKPIKVLDHPEGEGSMLVMEHLDMKILNKFQAQLGEQLGRLHLHNLEKIKRGDSDAITKFGFPGPTCCGYLPLENHWDDDWVKFYIETRLENQMRMLHQEHNNPDHHEERQMKELKELWEKLKAKIPEFFVGIDIKPSLLHGDLWGGNVAEIENSPVMFDPASFYGHHEFELGISGMFGGFSSAFYDAYHKLIPKEPGFEKRHDLYQLFHYLNHWNHFGSSYRPAAVSIMKRLITSDY